MKYLDDNEKEIIELFLRGHNISEMAKKLDATYSWVRSKMQKLRRQAIFICHHFPYYYAHKSFINDIGHENDSAWLPKAFEILLHYANELEWFERNYVKNKLESLVREDEIKFMQERRRHRRIALAAMRNKEKASNG